VVARADILAGRAVILINIQDTIEKQLRSIRGKMRMFANSMSEIGSDLFRGGLAGTAASIFPVAEFMNFQDQLLFLQTKLQVTDRQMKPLEKTIRQLGMSTSFSSKEVGQAATMYAQAGFSLVEVQASLQAALDLARGGQVDLSTSTTILSNALRTFQKDASNAASFASKFITAARLGTLDIVDLGESLKYSSGTFANFGVSIEEVLGLITTLANSGLKASLAGTSLNTAFLNMASNAPDLRALLGVELLEEDFKNPLQALKKLEAGLQKFTKIEQSGILQQLVNIRGGRAIQGLLLQGLDKVEANIKAVTESQDEARRSAAKLDSQLGGVWRRGVSAFQELAIAIGATSEGPLTKFGNRVATILNDLSRLTGKNQELVQSMLLLGPAALAAGVAILTITMLVSKIAMLITPVMMLNSALFGLGAKFIGTNIAAIKGLVDSIRTGFGGMSAVMLGLRRVVTTASGWLLIVEGLFLFGDKIPIIQDMLKGFSSAVKNAFGSIGVTLRDLKPSLDLLQRGFLKLFSGNIATGIKEIKNSFSDMANILRTGLSSAWLQFMKDIEPGAKILKGIFDGLLGTVKALITVLGSSVGLAFKTGKIVLTGDETLLDAIKQIFAPEIVKAFFTSIIESIGAIGQQLNAAIGIIASLLNALKFTFISMLKALASIPGFGGDAKKALDELDDNAKARKELEDDMFTLQRLYEEEKKNMTSHALTPYGKELANEMLRIQQELDNLGPMFGDIRYNVKEEGDKLAAAIKAIIADLNRKPETPDPVAARAAAAAAAAEGRNRSTLSSIMDGSYMSSGAGPAVKKLIASALTTVDPSAGMDILANTSNPQVMQGLSSFLMENKNVPKAMQQAADSLLNLTPEKIQEGAAGLWDGFKTAFFPKGESPVDPVMAAQLETATAGIGKAIVGDFQSSRGNMLQMVPKMEQLQEKANKLLEDGNGINEDIAANIKNMGKFA
jgi:TP901 family phage tail tape measure protein